MVHFGAEMKRFDREQVQVRFSWSRFLLPVTLAAILLVAILYRQFDRISMNMLNKANQDVLDQSDSVMSYIKEVFSKLQNSGL